MRVLLFVSLATLALAGCDTTGAYRARGVAEQEFLSRHRVEVLGDGMLEWVLTFIADCCEVESEIEREVEGTTVTVTPFYTYRPCDERCAVLLEDSAVYEFPVGSQVTIRVMGGPALGSLSVTWDTTVVVQ
jgi:hypothetical protein